MTRKKTPDTAPSSLGRPTKLTPDVQTRLEAALKAGATQELAAMRAGIGVSTFYAWKKKAEEGDADFKDFLDVIDSAAAEGAMKALEKITAAMDDDWKAAAWILERRYPEMYGRQRIEHTGKDGGPIEVKSYKGFSPDDWDSDVKPDS